MLILALETSCDETSAAVLEFQPISDKFQLLSNVVSSQVKIHSAWGGVVPNLAAREHLKNILPIIEKSTEEAKTNLEKIDLFCITQGPGLIPALLIGTNAAKTLSYYYQKPLLGIHHIEGHIYANFLKNNKNGSLNRHAFPILNLVVSGGHTQLILMKNHLDYQIIGQTQDDAAGEAFDKVAKILNLGYPGGPIVSKKAEEAKKIIANNKEFSQLEFPRPMIKSGNSDFSFSGLKTAVLYFFKELENQNLDEEKMENWKKVICKAFQDAVIDVLAQKTLKEVKKRNPKTVLLSGGVAANKELRKQLEKEIKKERSEVNFSCPELNFCGDNAAMIAVAGLARFKKLSKEKKLNQLKTNWRDLEANSNLQIN
ncbi:MAG: tRNA (adenosine(37)-N6)-threonylcarbamoyltransferase complex transferase subunit TsaD [Candidatus Moraniibacteriota bacterium]